MRDEIANIHWMLEKQENSRKKFTSASLITLKPLTVWIKSNYGKFFKRWEYQTTYLPPAKPICKSKNNSKNQTWKNGLVPNWERSTSRLLYCHLAYLTYMQRISCRMLGWMKHKLESRFPGEISITSGMQMTPPLWQKKKRN